MLIKINYNKCVKTALKMYTRFSWEVIFRYLWNRKCVHVSTSSLPGSCVWQLLVNHVNERQCPSPSLYFYMGTLVCRRNISLNYWDNAIKRHQPLLQKSPGIWSRITKSFPISQFCLNSDLILDFVFCVLTSSLCSEQLPLISCIN